MENAEIRQMINGPESFSPDMHAIMGEAPEVHLYNNMLVCQYVWCTSS